MANSTLRGWLTMTAQEIDDYIICKKIISTRPRRQSETLQRSYRNRFELYSEEYDMSFSVFLRQLVQFPENYSIGLIMQYAELGDITLFRCNGVHGPTARGEIGRASCRERV